jgi:hypothetical protein
MKKLLATLMLFASCAYAAFESTSDYNTVNFAYPNTTVSQTVVLNSSQQSGTTVSFEVLARNGGGRNYSSYPTQDDTGNVKIEILNSSQQVIATYQTNYSKNLRGPTNWSTAPGDTDQPFQTLSISGAMVPNAQYVRISMIGVDGAYWAGNYGPQWKVPTLKIDSGPNIAYNPEFGKYNTTIAQGWTSTGSSFGATCGTTSGSAICVTNDPNVEVNEHGGGYDATGGTTSGAAGGYTSTLSTTNQTPSTSQPPAIVVAITSTQQAEVNAARARQTYSNQLYITQVGSYNNIDVLQSGVYHLADITVSQDNNIIGLDQIGRKNYAYIEVNGGNNNISTYQTNSGGAGVIGHYSATTVTGNFNTTNVTQTGDGEKQSFILINGSNNNVANNQFGTGNKYSDIKATGNGHAIVLDQKDGGAHAARVEVTNAGGASNVNITQQGNTNQTYLLQQSCANAGGCSVTMTQQ